MPALSSSKSMPAEWSPHRATWISWPHNAETWPGLVEQAEAAMTDVVAALAPHELVVVNVLSEAHGDRVARKLRAKVASERFRIEQLPTDDAWIRDYGAIVVADREAPGGVAAIDFEYNAWGGKYPPYEQDRTVAARMSAILGIPRQRCSMVLEGGSVDVDGEGLGLVTEQCLLNPNRNPDLSRAEIEVRLGETLGLTGLVWLGHGIDGDDTDGHIDNLARFFAPRAVIAVMASDPSDPNRAALQENWLRLQSFRDPDGRALTLRELPLPDPLFHEGQRLPASYANFFIANEVVLMPAFGTASDQLAAGILADCFPGRRVVPIDCRALIVGLGGLHCLTQQVPAIVPGLSRAE